MAIQNDNQSTTGLVQRYMGSAYDVVKHVADNLPSLSAISSFASRNIGALDHEPTLRADGSPLQKNDEYFNTKNGTNYVLTALNPNVWTPTNILRTRVAAYKPVTTGTNQAILLNAKYRPHTGQLRVYLNGKSLINDQDAATSGLPKGDYAETNESTITIHTNMSPTDVLTVVRSDKVSTLSPAIIVKTASVVLRAPAGGTNNVPQQLPKGLTYDVDTGNLTVYRNGKLLTTPADYVEVDNHAISINHVNDGDVFVFRVGDVTTSGLDALSVEILKRSQTILKDAIAKDTAAADYVRLAREWAEADLSAGVDGNPAVLSSKSWAGKAESSNSAAHNAELAAKASEISTTQLKQDVETLKATVIQKATEVEANATASASSAQSAHQYASAAENKSTEVHQLATQVRQNAVAVAADKQASASSATTASTAATAATTQNQEAQTAAVTAKKFASGIGLQTDNISAKYWAGVAQANANRALQWGGVFNLTAAKEYPTVPNYNTQYIVQLPSGISSYTFTTGNLANSQITNGSFLFYDVAKTAWDVYKAEGRGIQEIVIDGIPHASSSVTLNLLAPASAQQVKDGVVNDKLVTPKNLKDSGVLDIELKTQFLPDPANGTAYTATDLDALRQGDAYEISKIQYAQLGSAPNLAAASSAFLLKLTSSVYELVTYENVGTEMIPSCYLLPVSKNAVTSGTLIGANEGISFARDTDLAIVTTVQNANTLDTVIPTIYTNASAALVSSTSVNGVLIQIPNGLNYIQLFMKDSSPSLWFRFISSAQTPDQVAWKNLGGMPAATLAEIQAGTRDDVAITPKGAKDAGLLGESSKPRTQADISASRLSNLHLFAASGIVHSGQAKKGSVIINDGMWLERDVAQNKDIVRIGYHVSSIRNRTGSSELPYAVTHIAGYICKHLYKTDTTYAPMEFNLPPVNNPDFGTVTGSYVQSKLSSLPVLYRIGDFKAIDDPKYGNRASTKSEAIARAFEGYVKNGDFRDGTQHWLNSGNGSIAVSNEIMSIDTTAGAGHSMSITQNLDSVSASANVLQLQIIVTEISNNAQVEVINSSASGNNYVIGAITRIGEYLNQYEYPSGTKSIGIKVTTKDGQAASAKIKAIYAQDNTVEVMLNQYVQLATEYFLTKIEADGHIYPYGMIQSELTTIEGIPTELVTGKGADFFAQYKGDITTTGRGVKLSTLSKDNLNKLISNPDHNLFYSDEGELVQFCCRKLALPNEYIGYLRDNHPTATSLPGVAIQGQEGVRPKYRDSYPITTYRGNAAIGLANYEQEVFLGVNTPMSQNPHVPAYNRECFLYIWGAVTRLNAGMYHPVYNPFGAGTDTAGKKWHESTIPVYGAQQCMANSANGDQASGVSGRPDGKFYDCVYSGGLGGIIDLRLPAWDVSDKHYASITDLMIKAAAWRGRQYHIMCIPVKIAAVDSSNRIVTLDAPYALNKFAAINDTVTGSRFKLIVDGLSVYLSSVNSQNMLQFTAVHQVQMTHLSAGQYAILQFEVYAPFEGIKESSYLCETVIGHAEDLYKTPDFSRGWLGNYQYASSTAHEITLNLRGVDLTQPMITKATKPTIASTWTTLSPSFGAENTVHTSAQLIGTNGKISVLSQNIAPFVANPTDNTCVYGAYDGLGQLWASASGRTDPHTYEPTLIESCLGRVGTSIASQTIARANYVAEFTTIPPSMGAVSRYRLDSLTPRLSVVPTPAVTTIWHQSVNNSLMRVTYQYQELHKDGSSWSNETIIPGSSSAGFEITVYASDYVLAGLVATRPIGYVKPKAAAFVTTKQVSY